MNYDRFIELLNLYLDHEISAADAKILEQEIRTNPERRRIYQDYCRLQKGTAALFEASRQQAASPALRRTINEINRKIAGRPAEPSVSWWTWGTSGILAAAACVTLVFVAQPKPTVSPDGAAFALKETSAPTLPFAADQAATRLAASDVAASTTLDAYLTYRSTEAVAPSLSQPVNFRPIAKVQNQPSLFKADALPAPEADVKALQLQPANQKPVEEMTAVQFKR